MPGEQRSNGSIGVAPIMQYTHVRNKKCNTQGSSPNVANFRKSDYLYLKELGANSFI